MVVGREDEKGRDLHALPCPSLAIAPNYELRRGRKKQSVSDCFSVDVSETCWKREKGVLTEQDRVAAQIPKRWSERRGARSVLAGRREKPSPVPELDIQSRRELGSSVASPSERVEPQENFTPKKGKERGRERGGKGSEGEGRLATRQDALFQMPFLFSFAISLLAWSGFGHDAAAW